jgi:hypothetical protein
MKPRLFTTFVRTMAVPRVQLLCGLLFAGVFLTACSEKSPTAAGKDIAGVYALATVNQMKMPATIDHEGAKLKLRSGTFTINSDGTCVSKMVFVPPSGNEVTREVKATYEREGAKLTMKWQGAGITFGSVEGDTLTMNNEGMVLAYRK